MANRSKGESPKNASPGDILLVIHEFSARTSDEISLVKGDRIKLIEKDDDFGDGWYLGQHLQTGSTGLFPEVYTILAPKVAATSTIAKPPVQAINVQPAAPAATKKLPTLPLPTKPAVPQASGGAPPPSPAPASPTTYNGLLPAQSFADSLQQIPANAPKSSPQTSSVMNEMHDVINEHITDLNKPARLDPSLQTQGRDRRPSTTGSGSNYSRDYIAGEETDEEEEAANASALTVETVKSWSPDKVAAYLESVGVEKSHCELFKVEEFTGEVLLGMEQSQVFLKEFDLGPIGRRMKTWQKIKALQDEVASQTPTSPRAVGFGQSATSGDRAFGASNDNARPSAGILRNLGQRRYSSTDKTLIGSPRTSSQPPGQIRRKQPSFDRGWTMAGQSTDSVPSSPRPMSMSTNHLTTRSADRTQLGKLSTGSSQLSVSTGHDKAELDQAYLNVGDAENRRLPNVLKKKGSSTSAADHKRISSAGSDNRRLSRGFFWQRNRDESPVKETTQKQTTEREGVRIVSEPIRGQGSPTVTKLEYGDVDEQKSNRVSGSRISQGDKQRASTVIDNKDREKLSARRGLRAISDAVTGRERALATSKPEEKILPGESAFVQSPADAYESANLGVEDANKSEYSTPTQGSATPVVKRKPKQQTSAYIRGLEKKGPQEQMIGADYSGWMKKKSSNLMTTWKPRFFVLKGRRLSYYYSENDTEEKGLIDISNHRVLPADHDFITGLHATLTGASTNLDNTSPNSTSLSQSSTSGSPYGSMIPSLGGKENKDPIFIFKLVPPRVGLSKGVNFTKPAIHYFALSSRSEGRLWMAALMKSTIDRDESQKVITTYQQKTITLEQARARRELPPFLKGPDEDYYGLGISTQSGAQEDNNSGSARNTRLRGVAEGDALSYGTDDASSTKSKPTTVASTVPSTMLESGPESLAGTDVRDLASNPSSIATSNPVQIPPTMIPVSDDPVSYGEPREGRADLNQIVSNFETNGDLEQPNVPKGARRDSEELTALPSNPSAVTTPRTDEPVSPLEKVQSRTKSFSFSRRESANNSRNASRTRRSSRRSSMVRGESSGKRTSGILSENEEDQAPLVDRLKNAGLW